VAACTVHDEAQQTGFKDKYLGKGREGEGRSHRVQKRGQPLLATVVKIRAPLVNQDVGGFQLPK
jgi:hypothetical protein